MVRLPLLLVLQLAFANLAVAFLAGHPSSPSSWILFSTAEGSNSLSSFDAYTPGESDELVFKDEVIGSGEEVAEEGDTLTVDYKATLYPSGKQFAQNSELVFELGAGKTMPGFDNGLVGARVGTKRVLRVPPSLAYGETGAGMGRIPPNADLEFECEVKGIARGQFDSIIAKIGTKRLIGFAVCFAALALTPLLG